MKVLRAKDFTAARAWDAAQIALIGGASIRLHWTDQPYPWHVNNGDEVFAVLEGQVNMHVREDGAERVVTLEPGDVFFAGEGQAHSARPCGEARVLVIEREGSV